MEHFINETTVMKFYLEQLEADNINFLQNKESQKQVIRELIMKLVNEEKMNDKIQIASDLWKVLFETSMSFISSDKQGYDKLFKYFDAFVEFEELIFASDSFYRDHTLHCIWVYFLGEYIRRKSEFHELFIDADSQRNILLGLEKIIEGQDKKQNNAVIKLNEAIELHNEKLKFEEAIRCIEALTHDLGYPLKKIEKINKSIKKVLPYFAIKNFEDFSFEYLSTQQEYINEFIEFLSRRYYLGISNMDETVIQDIFLKMFKINQYGTVIDVNMDQIDTITKEEKDALIQNIEVESNFALYPQLKFRHLNDFEEYKHGIMSAFLLFKNLRAFQNIEYNKSKDDFYYLKRNRNEQELAYNEILYSISAHTNDMFRISYLTDIEYLTFVDELEEFSRISRASQNREYVEEFCDTALYMEEGWLNIVFEFNNTELDNLDPQVSFKGRCRRFLTLFDIGGLSQNLKLRVTVVGKLPKDQNTYVLEIATRHAKILINGVEQNIPEYLKSNQFYTSEEYVNLK